MIDYQTTFVNDIRIIKVLPDLYSFLLCEGIFKFLNYEKIKQENFPFNLFYFLFCIVEFIKIICVN